VVGGAHTHLSRRHLGVLEERDKLAGPVAEPEVAGVGVVVVARLMREREPQEVAVEGRGAVEVAADRSDVVQPAQGHPARRRGEGHAAEGNLRPSVFHEEGASVPQRFDAGPAIAAAGAAVLLLSLFVEWFSPGLSAWGAFEALDVLLAVLALAALGLALARLREPDPGDGRILLGLGGVALLAVLVQLVDPPPLLDDDRELGPGAWLALVASALVIAGGVVSAARIAVTVTVSGHDPRRRVPAVDRRRAPVENPRPAAVAAERPEDDGPRTAPFDSLAVADAPSPGRVAVQDEPSPGRVAGEDEPSPGRVADPEADRARQR
jgi:hypothetical protein